MKQLSIAILLCAFSMIGNAAQINFLTSDFYGFEDGGSAYWIQNSEWSISTEKVADGTNYSMKFSSPSAVDASKKAHGGSNGSGINLSKGTYTLKMKVWVDKDAEISAFNFTLKSPWTNLQMKLDTVTKDTWVELSREFTLNEDVVNSGSLLTMTSSYGGKGTLFVDEIQIWGEGQVIVEPELIPFSSSISTLNDGNLNLPKGLYAVRMKVYMPEITSISKVYTHVENPWVTLNWDLETIEKGKWVELSQEMRLEKDVDNSSFKVFVSNHPDFGGGKGQFFIDDIQFVWKTGLAIGEVHPFDFSIFPNPANDVLHVDIDKPGQYSIYSLRGNIVAKGSLNSRSTISIRDFKSGMYLFQVKTKVGRRVKQFIIR